MNHFKTNNMNFMNLHELFVQKDLLLQLSSFFLFFFLPKQGSFFSYERGSKYKTTSWNILKLKVFSFLAGGEVQQLLVVWWLQFLI